MPLPPRRDGTSEPWLPDVPGPREAAVAYFLDNHHGDGRLALWCAAPEGAQAMLVDSNPDHYFLPPYVTHLGWIGVRLDRKAPWNEIAMVLEAAHQARYKPPRQRKAPAKLVKDRELRAKDREPGA